MICNMYVCYMYIINCEKHLFHSTYNQKSFIACTRSKRPQQKLKIGLQKLIIKFIKTRQDRPG